jgi:signal transduction histidine kinase
VSTSPLSELEAEQLEAARLEALARYGILDSDHEQSYQDLVDLAAKICGTPIALMSLIDAKRQWFKATVGIDARETPRDLAFCHYAIQEHAVMEVNDALADARFANNPLVTSDPHIRFYAGAPLVTADGYALGTLCAIDRHPRTLDDDQRSALRVLARQVSNQLELRLANRRLEEQAARLEALNDNRNRLFKIIAHDLRSPFQGLLTMTELLDTSLEDFSPEQVRRYLGLIRNSAGATYNLLDNLLQWARVETGSLPCEPVLLPLARQCDSALAVLQSMLERKGQPLEFAIDPGLEVFADRKMFEAIVRNLVANAAKFSPPGATIRLAARPDGEGIRLEVEDRGRGIAPARRDALLSGENSDSSPGTAGEEGTGLGFRLVREFVELNRGGLAIETPAEGGTRVVVTLPRSGA